MNSNSCAKSPPGILQTPAYPNTGSAILNRLKKAVEDADCPPGVQLNQKRFGELLGLPKSTSHDWINGKLAQPIIRFLCGLERLRERQRQALLRELFRPCPRLQDPRISHDPGAVRALTALLEQPEGLTFVQGPERTYLGTALGNSAAWRVAACGLDVHRPDKFVPVPGVWYLPGPCPPGQLAELLERLAKFKAPLVFLSGVWGMLPQARPRIAGWAATRHVIVVDEPDLPSFRCRSRISLVTAARLPADPLRLRITVRTV